MLSLSAPVHIYLCTVATDMRRSFDGLMRMAEEHIKRNVLEGGLYVFINRRRDRVKLLWWQDDGLCIWYKRLEAGTFELPHVNKETSCIEVTVTQMNLILGGIALSSAQQRKRFQKGGG